MQVVLGSQVSTTKKYVITDFFLPTLLESVGRLRRPADAFKKRRLLTTLKNVVKFERVNADAFSKSVVK